MLSAIAVCLRYPDRLPAGADANLSKLHSRTLPTAWTLIATIYVEIIRGTPLLLQLYFLLSSCCR